jgi:hypothetical protein
MSKDWGEECWHAININPKSVGSESNNNTVTIK